MKLSSILRCLLWRLSFLCRIIDILAKKQRGNADWNRFTTDILENGVAAACAQYGIPIIAYSPIGRGMLTGQFKKFDDLPQDSLLRSFDFPRFQRENFEKNMQAGTENRRYR